MAKRYIMKSSIYSDDYREFKNLNEVRKYIKNFYPPKVKEVYVFSINGKQHGNVLFNEKGVAFWYTPSTTWYIKSDGSLGQIVAKYNKKKKEWHPFGL